MDINFKFLQCKGAEPPEIESIAVDKYIGYLQGEISEDLGECVAVSKIPTQKDIDDMLKFFEIDSNEMVNCPECDMRCQMKFMITHLNDKGNTWSASYKSVVSSNSGPTQIMSFDNHSWTFKQIGKWLDSLGY